LTSVILVDTSAWINHLRFGDERLMAFLREGRVRTSDVVIGELLLGSGLPKDFTKDLLALPRAATPSSGATRVFIERHRRSFAGSGIGWADAQILYTAAHVGMRVHTADGPVRRVCRSLSLHLA
jgi:hypothetical protein